MKIIVFYAKNYTQNLTGPFSDPKSCVSSSLRELKCK